MKNKAARNEYLLYRLRVAAMITGLVILLTGVIKYKLECKKTATDDQEPCVKTPYMLLSFFGAALTAAAGIMHAHYHERITNNLGSLVVPLLASNQNNTGGQEPGRPLTIGLRRRLK